MDKLLTFIIWGCVLIGAFFALRGLYAGDLGSYLMAGLLGALTCALSFSDWWDGRVGDERR